MTIKYHLHKNHLPNGADAYRARVAYQRVVDLEGVLDQMVSQNSSITRADMLAVFEDFLLALLRLLLLGARVVTPFGEFGLTIKGSFASEQDKFQAGRHQIELVLKPGKRLEREFKRQARARKVESKVPYPTPWRYTNLADPAAADRLTPGQMARLTGHWLKFDPTDERQGLFLLPLTAGSDSTPSGPAVRVSQVGHNTSRKLIFLTPPDLSPGPYRLELRAVFGLDQLRTGRLPQLLLVA
jgi:hypothetical protein